MAEKKSLGIFGGTFDPIHNGHLYINEKILQNFPMQQIRFLPCYQPVHRKMPFANIEQRLAMIKLAIKNHPQFVVDETEARRKEPSYMYDTLQIMRQELGNQVPLALILASDAFALFTQWYRWEEIINYTHLIIVQRSKENILTNHPELKNYVAQKGVADPNDLLKSPAGSIFWSNIIGLPISATEIRENIAEGKDVSKEIPKAVLDYIKENNLYRIKY